LSRLRRLNRCTRDLAELHSRFVYEWRFIETKGRPWVRF
jgi:hypothetical protein